MLFWYESMTDTQCILQIAQEATSSAVEFSAQMLSPVKWIQKMDIGIDTMDFYFSV